MSILNEILNARQSALNEDYQTAIGMYQKARAEVEKEKSNCHDVQQNKVWSDMLIEIDDEVKAIKQIIASNESFFAKLSSDSKIPPEDNIVENHIKDSPIQVVKPAHRPAINARPLQNKPAAKPLEKPQNRGRKPQPPKQVGKPNDQKGGAKNKSPVELDPASNPLVQQIIDMGILIREPNVSWDSIAGLADVKKLLRRQLVLLPLRPDLCKGILSPWKSVLLYGPPGTGKTFLAKAVATECKRTFFNITSATITSRFLGESEKLVSFLFQYAEQCAPSTIFFDEIDSIASQRGTSNEGESGRKIKAQLLTSIEGIGASDNNDVFILAATNFPWDLDEALLRRFQKRIYIPLPDKVGRRAILEMNIKDLVDDDFDFDGFAQKLDGYSCADIANLCRDAAQRELDAKIDDCGTTLFKEMPYEDIRVRITNEAFQDAMSRRKSSVDPASLAKFEEWRKLKSAE